MDCAADGVRFGVRVRPGAARVSVGGSYGDGALVIAVHARPVDGQANRAVVTALADAFGVRRAAVDIVLGHRSRDKIVFVRGDPAALRDRLQSLRDG